MSLLLELRNILRVALSPSYALAFFGKVVDRVSDRRPSAGASYRKWLAEHSVLAQDCLGPLEPSLWAEAEAHYLRVNSEAKQIFSSLPVTLGGAGDTRLLYWLVRYMRPECVVETGVAAGFSSHAILSALTENGNGFLHSSDFPYFRLEDPEKYIGIIVPESLRARWRLYTKGDRVNLPQILSGIESVDMFHYDSDKRYAGRHRAMSLILEKMAPSGVILMDDIGDNEYFYHLTEQCASRPFWIFQFENKHIGMLGPEGGSSSFPSFSI